MARLEAGKQEPLSAEKLARVNGLLLAICAALFAATAVLAVYIVWDKYQLAQLKGGLLAERELQEQLLANQPLDHAVYPHLDQGISYVLNPDMPYATWYADPNSPYPINSLGLRGTDIASKTRGVKRIALVGDSVLFGWKIAEHEKVASIMQALADERLGRGKYEFITIALPGWNIKDQDHFLRNHLGRLNPDYIIWSIIRNDLIDSAGVVPPGMLVSWNAPQKQHQQPFQFLNPAELMDAPAPGILSRWHDNLRRIVAFKAEYKLPVSLLWWRSQQRPLLDYLLTNTHYDLPVLHIPGLYRYDEDNWCVAFPDCHPTPWANERLAVGLLSEMVKQGVMEAMAWTAAEQTTVDNFQRQAELATSAKQQQDFMLTQASKVPNGLSEGATSPILFGVVNGNMRKNGIMLLRQQGEQLTLNMDVFVSPGRPGPNQGIKLGVRTHSGLIKEQYFPLSPNTNSIGLDFPGGAHFDLYEIEWQFDYAECNRPSTCLSAQLLNVQLQTHSSAPEG